LLDEILEPIHKQFSERVATKSGNQLDNLPISSGAHFHSIVLGAVDFVNETIFARFE